VRHPEPILNCYYVRVPPNRVSPPFAPRPSQAKAADFLVTLMIIFPCLRTSPDRHRAWPFLSSPPHPGTFMPASASESLFSTSRRHRAGRTPFVWDCKGKDYFRTCKFILKFISGTSPDSKQTNPKPKKNNRSSLSGVQK
jgi:hypothetical protein